MADDTHEKASVSPEQFGASLAPSLIDACGGSLSDLRFFTTAWQQGGAATAYGAWCHDDGTEREVVVKAPVGWTEFQFTRDLGARNAPTPRVAACGDELGAYDLAWLVIERIPGDPLSSDLKKKDVLDLCAAAASFYKESLDCFGPPTKAPTPVEWESYIERARQSVRDNAIPEEQRWKEALKATSKALPGLISAWRARSTRFWRHGDFHPGNAMRRPEDSAWGPSECVLIDLARVTPGHWVTDAVYLERIHWGKPEMLHGVKPAKAMAKAMRKIGLDPGDDYSDLANIRRLLTAACTPVFLEREGHPKHVIGALEALEHTLKLV